MCQEKKRDFAIYTLAASILVSSAIISSSSASAAPSDRDIINLKSCINKNMTNVTFSFMDIKSGRDPFFFQIRC